MRLDELERELRAERPRIDPRFASDLDEWAARGFPRGGELDPRRGPRAGTAPGRLRRGWRRLRGAPPRRILAPVAAAATLAAIVGGVLAGELGREGALTGGEPALDAGGTVGGDDPVGEATLPARPDRPAASPPSADAPGEPQVRELAPGASGEARSGPTRLVPNAADAGRPGRRRVARTVSIALATAPRDFRAAADRVLDVVGDHNGFVMHSTVTSGDPEVDGAELGRASFQLRIPAPRLGAALGALSDLGHLVSRSDGSRDITARFQSARERIETFTQARDRLLRQLEEAVAEAEQESIGRWLRIVEGRLESARDDLARARQRVRIVPVTVTIAADATIRDAGGWGIDEALDDAAAIIRTAAALAAVAAAVLLPLALLALLALAVSRRLARRGRERALDES